MGGNIINSWLLFSIPPECCFFASAPLFLTLGIASLFNDGMRRVCFLLFSLTYLPTISLCKPSCNIRVAFRFSVLFS